MSPSIDTTSESFAKDVFETSQEKLVVVDFWAAWCQPCMMLKPILEGLAERYDGRFQLVKANADEMQRESAQFGVQALPSVFAVWDGAPIDGFQGVLPESQIEAWLDRLLESVDISRAGKLEFDQPEQAAELYQRILKDRPDFAPALIGTARLALQAGDSAAAQAIIDQLEQRGFLEPAAENIKAKLDLGAHQGELGELKRRAESAPDDLALRTDWARAEAGAGQHEQALELLLSVVENDHGDHREQARLAMLEVFRVLPEDSELTRTYRRKLSSLLF